jgi:dihydroorotase/N-acyl-D-amino-acid deacylase
MKRNIGLALFILALGCGDSGYDYVIRNGRIIDGLGNPWYAAAVGIKGDRIEKVGRIAVGAGRVEIDAVGRIVSPGFIDIHSHVEGGIRDDPTAHNMIAQGATTIVGGNCGGSPLDLAKFFAEVELKGMAINVGVLVGHGSVHSRVMGNDGRDPTAAELAEMVGLIEREMRAGALGMSTGLKYRPGTYSKTDEVVALARAVSKYGGFYASHLREEGLKLFESMEEALTIGRMADIPVQISHHKAAGIDMWGRTTESLALMEAARAEGLDVTTDQHPYPATFAGITIIFPPWALEGTKIEINARLADRSIRKRLRDGIVENIIHDRGGNNIRNITIGVHTADRSLEGKNFAEILEQKGREPTMAEAAELAIELYETGGGTSAIFHCLSMEDVVRIMKHPLTMHASDAGLSQLGVGKVHPRHYGHFPRVLGRHVRERGDLTLPEAIRKMTSFPASRIGARDRGIITEGMRADIVIFDPETIIDKATWSEPHQYPVGIDYVFVNGEIVVDHGEVTGALPGRVIYGPGYRED